MKTMMQFSLVAVNGRGFQSRTVERSDILVGEYQNSFNSFFCLIIGGPRPRLKKVVIEGVACIGQLARKFGDNRWSGSCWSFSQCTLVCTRRNHSICYVSESS